MTRGPYKAWLFVLIGWLLSGCRPISPAPVPSTVATIQAPTPAIVSQSMTRGETLEIELEQGLFFRLAPYAEGWEIQVGDHAAPEYEYSYVLTPPFHGINDRQVQGWHFRNADNTGPNAPGDLNVNAPQATREFCYVLDVESYQRAVEQIHVQGMLSPIGEDIRSGMGRLIIDRLELGNLMPGQRAYIEAMEFRVEFELDAPCRLFE